MKTSIDFLPKSKQKELNDLCKLIERTISVEMILLFGSVARDEWKEDIYTKDGITYDYTSDFDILVIVEDKKVAENLKLWSFIENKFEQSHLTPVTLIPHDIPYVNRQLREGQYFYLEIKRDGILLFDSKRFQLAERQKTDPKRQQRNAQNNYDFWFKNARRFYQHYIFDITDGFFNVAAFQLHQATEGFYNAILLVFTGSKPKAHDITCLGKRAKVHCRELETIFPKKTKEEIRLFELLREAYVSSRYDKRYKITKEELEYLGGRVKKLEALTEKICMDKIEKIRKEASL